MLLLKLDLLTWFHLVRLTITSGPAGLMEESLTANTLKLVPIIAAPLTARKPVLACSIGFLLPAAIKKASASPHSFKHFGAVPTGFSVQRFTSHLSYSLLVSDSGPLAQLYPGGVSTRKLGNPFQVTL
jgi:hypothetical protein